MNYNLISFSAGPSYLSEKTLNALHDVVSSGFLSVSHRSEQFSEVSKMAIEGLRKNMRIPESYHIFYHPSSTTIWDTVLQNFVQNTSYHFVCGEFSKRFFDSAKYIGLNALSFDTPIGEIVDYKKAVIPKEAELITITHNETRSGLMWPMHVMREIKDAHPHALTAIDFCSSFGGMKFDWEAGDIWISSSQKCLSLPAGMGILIVNPKAVEKSKSVKRLIPDWRRLETMLYHMKKYQIFETPNSILIGTLAILMRDYDLEKTHDETYRKAELLYNADLDWKPIISDYDWRSVTTPHFIVDDSAKWHRVAKEHGFELGAMFGDYASKGFRIANFPNHTYEIMQRLIRALKTIKSDSDKKALAASF
ncbi:MAG: aminotransferase class V-fold PLP-dependent enzyme [Parachlamydiaceae bacterium]